MDSLSRILFYIIGTFLNFKELNRLSLASKSLNERTEEAKELLAKREVMRIFSSDLEGFRMIIHSISYELGPKDHSTPTLNDGYNWLEILKEGLILKSGWHPNFKPQLTSISKILKNPENNLPSFHSNNFSKLETTMQERLFEELIPAVTPNFDFASPKIAFEFEKFNELQ